jgi:predicted alpha/beta-fold hydrolase
MDDGGQLCLDWVVHCDNEADDADADAVMNKPTVIIFHGLNGGSTSVYLFLQPFISYHVFTLYTTFTKRGL